MKKVNTLTLCAIVVTFAVSVSFGQDTSTPNRKEVDRALARLTGDQVIALQGTKSGLLLGTSDFLQDAKEVDLSTDPNYGILFVEGEALASRTEDGVLHFVSQPSILGRFIVHLISERDLRRSGKPFGLWVSELPKGKAQWIDVKIPQANIFAEGKRTPLVIDADHFSFELGDELEIVGEAKSRGSEPAYYLILCDESNDPIAGARFAPYEFSYIKEL